jgi:hypothetical protein
MAFAALFIDHPAHPLHRGSAQSEIGRPTETELYYTLAANTALSSDYGIC